MNRLTRRELLKLIGLAALAWLPLVPGETVEPAGPRLAAGPDHPNILILVLDALTARHLSLHGYPRRTCPQLEQLAGRASVYHRHTATANFTVPGTASLLTGVYPWKHRALHFHGRLPPTHQTPNLFQLFQGYRRFAYTHNPMAYTLLHQMRPSIDRLPAPGDLCRYADSPAGRWFGGDFPAAFEAELLTLRNGAFPSGSLVLSLADRARRSAAQARLDAQYRAQFPRGLPSYADEVPPSFMIFTLEDAIDWTIRQAAGPAARPGETVPPFLGYVHLLPPHHPYITRQEFFDMFLNDSWQPPEKATHHFQDGNTQANLNLARRLYDESIAYADAEVARLVEALASAGLLENTWLFITSDHGEMFERGILSHITPVLYEPLLHIPLLALAPGQDRRQDIHSLTSNVDLLPSLAAIAGLPTPPGLDGSPLPGIAGALEDDRRSVFAFEAKGAPAIDPLRQATAAITRLPYKLIYYTGYPDYPDQFELYDLQADPEEMNNLYREDLPVAQELKAQLVDRINS